VTTAPDVGTDALTAHARFMHRHLSEFATAAIGHGMSRPEILDSVLGLLDGPRSQNWPSDDPLTKAMAPADWAVSTGELRGMYLGLALARHILTGPDAPDG
jgi:hypothetical protein